MGFKRVILIGFLINLIILFINFFIFKRFEINFNRNQNAKSVDCAIEIWSKASIGDFFWEHILKSKIQTNIGDGYYRFGKTIERNLILKFRTGYSLTPTSLKEYLDKKLAANKRMNKINLILILNGRTKSSVQNAKSFLNKLNSFKNQINLGVLLLGNENCFNNWIKSYLEINEGLIKFLFIVYDWNQIDNEIIYQWPLGVATYRNFSLIQIDKDLIKSERSYLCNYVTTIYKNTSREELLNLINQNEFKDKCLVKARMQWLPNETNETLLSYEYALR